MFLEGFQKYKKPVAERNNTYKTRKMIVRNIISVELSYEVSTSAGLTCIDSNALKIDKYYYKVTIFKKFTEQLSDEDTHNFLMSQIK